MTDRGILWSKLESMQFPKEFINILKAMYKKDSLEQFGDRNGLDKLVKSSMAKYIPRVGRSRVLLRMVE